MKLKQVLIYAGDDARSMRAEHIVRTLDLEHFEVRVYKAGADFNRNEILKKWNREELPVYVINNKAKSYENFIKETIGVQEIDENPST